MKFYLSIFLMVFCFESYSQLQSNTAVNWMVIDTSNSNLPSNYITDITKDKNGDIWVSTGEGFAKFLGQNQWQVFHTPNVTFNDACLAIESQDSIIWVATVHGLVRCCNGQVSIFAPYTPIVFNINTTSLKVDGDNLWIGTYQYGLFKWDGTTLENFTMTNTGMPIGNVWSIDLDPFGKKWICGIDNTPGPPSIGALVSFDDINWTLYDTSNSGLGRFPQRVTIDQFGNKWITELEGALYKFDDSNWLTFDTSSVSTQASFQYCKPEMDHLGNKWVSTLSGIAKYDDQTWTFFDSTFIPFPNPIQTVVTILTESNGNKFMGTYCGLLIFNENGIVLSTGERENFNSNSAVQGFLENGIFYTRFEMANTGSLSGLVSDDLGRIVYSFAKNINSPGEYSEAIDFSTFKSGVYFLTLSLNHEKISMKILNLK
jgi:ligand-binding sensor domain-containing protein